MSNRSSLEKEQQEPNLLILKGSTNTATTASEKSPTTSTSTEPSLLDIDDEFTNSKPEPQLITPEPNTPAAAAAAIKPEASDEPQGIHSEEEPAPVEEEADQAVFDDFDTAEQSEQKAEENDEFNNFDTLQEQQQNVDDDDFDDFGEFDNDGFVDANGDDDFGDFDDFEAAPAPIETMQEEPEEPEEEIPKTPTEAEFYVDMLENRPEDMKQFIEDYLNTMWGGVGHTEVEEEQEKVVSSPIEQNDVTTDILNTPCSRDLWSKLSRDTVFYNPVTGAVGQFQWTRSETNKAYLNALGVTFNSEEKSPASVHSPTSTLPNHIHTSPTSTKQQRRQSNVVDGKRLTASNNASSTTSLPETSSAHLRSASATGGLRVVTSKMDESAKEAKKEADQEMELDIDIARAYCELTEETIRIFPDVKLNAMVIELSRLQRQAADYLDNLLDQREQLKMDAETYNDLISCIVGHAQRLHVQSKDASPAMVSKKKKSNSGTGSGFLRRKNTTTNVSMGGGVVGVKHQQPSSAGGPPPKRTVSSASQIPTTSESRRSM